MDEKLNKSGCSKRMPTAKPANGRSPPCFDRSRASRSYRGRAEREDSIKSDIDNECTNTFQAREYLEVMPQSVRTWLADRSMLRKAPSPRKRARNNDVNAERSQMTPQGSQPVPKSAPRDTVIRGRFTFIKGVRLRDYHLPHADRRPPMPRDAAFQCKDGFSEHEAVLGYPRPMTKTPRTADKRRSSFERMPPTPPSPETRASPCDQRPSKRIKNGTGQNRGD
ncbi:hypothetical protein LIA77_07609 [Sarocladium implicatum]|nr:hypothetical protein LIA77_07609 [Sarocladium implicatum]